MDFDKGYNCSEYWESHVKIIREVVGLKTVVACIYHLVVIH